VLDECVYKYIYMFMCTSMYIYFKHTYNIELHASEHARMQSM
jgi:hypothetical protein